MFCSKCGAHIDDMAVVCPRCGCPTGNYYRQATPAAPQKQSNGLAVAGFVLSIFSLWFGALFCIVPIIALALSASGLKASKKGKLRRRACRGGAHHIDNNHSAVGNFLSCGDNRLRCMTVPAE